LQEQRDGEPAVALYDFNADGEDELSIQEGESLAVLERDADDWWKVRNSHGAEGVVPASYVEVSVSYCVRSFSVTIGPPVIEPNY
jgi:actin cytoskeleton-regulatory complex protein SLA1